MNKQTYCAQPRRTHPKWYRSWCHKFSGVNAILDWLADGHKSPRSDVIVNLSRLDTGFVPQCEHAQIKAVNSPAFPRALQVVRVVYSAIFERQVELLVLIYLTYHLQILPKLPTRNLCSRVFCRKQTLRLAHARQFVPAAFPSCDLLTQHKTTLWFNPKPNPKHQPHVRQHFDKVLRNVLWRSQRSLFCFKFVLRCFFVNFF